MISSAKVSGYKIDGDRAAKYEEWPISSFGPSVRLLLFRHTQYNAKRDLKNDIRDVGSTAEIC